MMLKVARFGTICQRMDEPLKSLLVVEQVISYQYVSVFLLRMVMETTDEIFYKIDSFILKSFFLDSSIKIGKNC